MDHRVADQKITLKTRDDYHRHTLLGINVFGLEMFKQFQTELGLYDEDPMMRPSLNTENGVATAIHMSANVIAKTSTADVKVLSVDRSFENLKLTSARQTSRVTISHRVWVFGEAFLNLQVLDRNENVLWASGNVAPDDKEFALKGVIVDGAGRPLLTEIFTPFQQRIQPHFWRDNPITRENQVEIYEELVTNPEGYLTSSSHRSRPQGEGQPVAAARVERERSESSGNGAGW